MEDIFKVQMSVYPLPGFSRQQNIFLPVKAFVIRVYLRQFERSVPVPRRDG